MPELTGRVAPATEVKRPADEPERPIRRKRGLRLALLSIASAIVLLGATAAGAFAYVNHEVGSIARIPVTFTAMNASGTAGGMTLLLTSYQSGYTGTGGDTSDTGQTGLVMLLHLDADGKAGGAVSIRPQTQVPVPGHGTMRLWDVLATGGPSLLAKTVQSVTGVPINHYARVNFNDVASTINALGGVTVDLPQATTAFGHRYPAGLNQLTGTTAMDYARQRSLTEDARVERQQSLMRAILTKLSGAHLLSSPVTAMRVLKSFTKTLTFDSNLSNAEVESLATKFGELGPGRSTFVTAPTITADGSTVLNTAVASQLWKAVNQDALAAFAVRYPALITPIAPH